MSELERLKREYYEGSAFIKDFKVETILNKVKSIVKVYIPEEDYKSLENCEVYSLGMSGSTICDINFTFGKAWQSYKVHLGPINFTITKQKGHAKYEPFKEMKTYELANLIDNKYGR